MRTRRSGGARHTSILSTTRQLLDGWQSRSVGTPERGSAAVSNDWNPGHSPTSAAEGLRHSHRVHSNSETDLIWSDPVKFGDALCRRCVVWFLVVVDVIRGQGELRSKQFVRRLISLIFAGRNRIIVIRRELPRTKSASWAGAFRIERSRILLDRARLGRRQPPIAFVQPMLHLPGDLLHFFADPFLPLAQRGTDARGKTIRPGGFDHHPSQMGIARLGDGSAPLALAAGVLAGDRAGGVDFLVTQISDGQHIILAVTQIEFFLPSGSLCRCLSDNDRSHHFVLQLAVFVDRRSSLFQQSRSSQVEARMRFGLAAVVLTLTLSLAAGVVFAAPVDSNQAYPSLKSQHGRSPNGPPPGVGQYQLLAWSELGMHCMDGKDYSIFAVLPPLQRNSRPADQDGRTAAAGHQRRHHYL